MLDSELENIEKNLRGWDYNYPESLVRKLVDEIKNKKSMLAKLAAASSEVLKNFYKLDRAFSSLEDQTVRQTAHLFQYQTAVDVAKKAFEVLLNPGHPNYSSEEMQHLLAALFLCDQLDMGEKYPNINQELLLQKIENIALKDRITRLESKLENHIQMLNEENLQDLDDGWFESR